LWLYGRFVTRQQAQLAAGPRGVFLTGAAGALFMLPTFLIGTPLIEFRTMQLLALCVALPYLARAVVQPMREPLAASGGWFRVRHAGRLAPVAMRQA
jgi:hypothetical protein